MIRNKWKLVLYSLSGMGLNMLNLVVGSYLCDAMMVEGFDANIENWTYANKTLVVAGLWSAFILIGKIMDGVIDIPLAALTDKLESRWGRRRPPILVGMVLTLAAYLAFLLIPVNGEKNLLNTVYFGVMLCVFYSAYTLTLVTYYATFSEIVDNDQDRLRLSNYKTVFDVVYFVLGYALIPALIGAMNIRMIALLFAPLALTMLIPLFMIKERSSVKGSDLDENTDRDAALKQNADEGETVGMVESVRYLAGNRPFLIWLAVYAVLQFGVQLYLTAQNVFYSGVMGFEGFRITLLMAFAFAPIPFTLILYTHVIKKRGLITGFRYSVLLFMLAMATSFLCRAEWITNLTLRTVVAIIGCILSAFGTGCFFSINYTVPSAIADEERRQTGISHPAMFFAIQGLISGIATGISTGIIWVNLKDFREGEFVWIMPIIVIVSCALSLALTWLLPKKIRSLGKD